LEPQIDTDLNVSDLETFDLDLAADNISIREIGPGYETTSV
jgi:hypothetical protein